MKYNYDLTVIVPGIRNTQWEILRDHIKGACGRYKYEIIFSGPHALPESLQKDLDVKYIKNYGSPTRALHLATLISEGRFFTWLSDDAHLYPNSIDLSMDLLLAKNPDKDIVCMRYTEGKDHSGAEFAPSYWVSGTHPDLHAPAVDRNWKIPIVMLLAQERYKDLGGFDHGYHHLNMNLHDFAFRAQRDGTEVLMSPTQVQNCDFEENRTPENSPIIAAFWNNDRPRFWQQYAIPGERPLRIDPENWRESSPVWELRKFV
jgi:hypothetical protein